MSKGEALTLGTIVVAALVIIVLVVLVFIFTGKISVFRENVDACSGVCVETQQECADLGKAAVRQNCLSDHEGVEYCCL